MVAVRLSGPTDVAGWRAAARRMRLAGLAPEQVHWSVGGPDTLFEDDLPPAPDPQARFTAPRAFLDLARDVLLNRAPDRFDLMYRLLWRQADTPDLLRRLTDPQVARALAYRKAVWQAEHKMHAFVRFRRLPGDGPESYAAWFEPPHYVVEKAAPFFVRRLANVRFAIFTPYVSVDWDGTALRVAPGPPTGAPPAEDSAEDAWKVYFASVFNPARLNPEVMRQHMPKSYWRNLPEAAQIPDLVAAATRRTDAMVAASPSIPSVRADRIAARRAPDPIPGVEAPPASLEAIAQGAAACRRCPLHRDATQAVTGEGPATARLMIVGEQPGDAEDLVGRPFVGPAGALLDRALAEAGLDRRAAWVTNAVKHFKHDLRGKRRLHKTPGAGEIAACRWWLDAERAVIRPRLILALGATAAGAVLGRPAAVLRDRGAPIPIAGGGAVLVTVHPAYLLRLPDPAARDSAYTAFVEDLRLAARLTA